MKVDDQPCTVLDAASGSVRYDWQEGDTDTVGFFHGEFIATISGKELTFPGSGTLIVEILDRL